MKTEAANHVARWAFRLLLLAAAGCGGTATSTSLGTSTASQISPLNGTWLIAGTLPTLQVSAPSKEPFGLTLTLDVDNGQIIAGESDFYPCGNGSAVGGAGNFASATIAPDGTFTLQTPQFAGLTPTVALIIQGSVPRTAGAAWTGSYSATNANAGCAPVSGTFIATPMEPVAGTYTGAGSLGAPGATATPIAISVTLQQGGPASLDPPTGISPVNSVSALAGTISITGSPCFNSGVMSIPSGDVIGSTVGSVFTMNDGSRLLLNAGTGDTAASSVILRSLLVSGGSCDGWGGSFGVTLVRR